MEDRARRPPGGGRRGAAGLVRVDASWPARPSSAAAAEEGTAVVRIRFARLSSSPPGVASPIAGPQRLLKLLRSHPSYRFLAGDGPAGALVIVQFSYRSTVELSRLYDQLLWLLELSSHSVA